MKLPFEFSKQSGLTRTHEHISFEVRSGGALRFFSEPDRNPFRKKGRYQTGLLTSRRLAHPNASNPSSSTLKRDQSSSRLLSRDAGNSCGADAPFVISAWNSFCGISSEYYIMSAICCKASDSSEICLFSLPRNIRTVWLGIETYQHGSNHVCGPAICSAVIAKMAKGDC